MSGRTTATASDTTPDADVVGKFGTGVLSLLTFGAPIFTVVMMTTLSVFSSAPVNGLLYAMWFIMFSALRYVVIQMVKGDPTKDENFDKEQCGLPKILMTDDPYYSTFTLSFVFAYLIFPMIIATVQTGNVMNYYVLSVLFIWYVANVLTLYSAECNKANTVKYLAGNTVGGLCSAAVAACGIMYPTTLKQYLFVAETASGKSACSMAGKQKFKCSVQKNGQLL